MRNVALATFALDLLLLEIDGEGDVGHAAIRQRRAARQVRHVLHMGRPHDPRVVDGDVHENLVEFHILLSMRVEQIVILHAR